MKIMRLGWTVLLLVSAGLWLTGCCCTRICRENREAGLASIVCQPMDVEVRNADQVVKFEVKAVGRGLSYQWYRYDEQLPEKDDRFEGATSAQLTVKGGLRFIAAPYRCEISSKSPSGDPGDEVRTATRSALLIFNPSMRLIMQVVPPPNANLPPSGSHSSISNFTYCSAAPPFRGISPTNAAATKGTIQLGVGPIPPGTIQDTRNYAVRVMDGKGKQFMALDSTTDPKTKWFNLSTSPYTFQVYYTCDGATSYRTIYLLVSWPGP